MKITTYLLIIFLTFVCSNCSSSSSSGELGGTETGSTDAGDGNFDADDLGTRAASVASALVPTVVTGASDTSVNSRILALIDGTETEWDIYTNETNAAHLEEIFGSPDEGFATVSKIRVLLDQFASDLDDVVDLEPGLLENEPAVTCEDADTLVEDEAANAMIDVAFYGAIPNGDSANPHFACHIDFTAVEGDDGGDIINTMIYGFDNDHVIRYVRMNQSTFENTEETATRGTEQTLYQVVYASYTQTEATADTTAESSDAAFTDYLDLHYAQASVYPGANGTYGNDDDVIFRSRTRITGIVNLDADATVINGLGDFTVTKYDRSSNEDESVFTNITKVVGRGNYATNGFSLLNIDSDYGDLNDIPGIFCIQHTAETSIPSYADSTNCTELETALAFTDFAFDVSPELDATFENNVFFEGNDTDLIDETGTNFVLPAYSIL